MIALPGIVAALALLQSPPSDGVSTSEPPWPIRLGARVEKVNRVFPTVDRVVLVPDTATYVDELSKWSPRGRWPVLIEDAHFAPMFVRRFRPAQLIRRESVGSSLPASREERERMLTDVVVRTWGGDPAGESIRATFERLQYPPPGVVITSVGDGGWTAAVALAAGRGQPLGWLEGARNLPGTTMSREAVTSLAAAVDEIVDAQGYAYRSLGDVIDTITICRDIGGRADWPKPGSTELEPAATTDILGRNADGTRYAFVGWIFGDEVRSAYVAMSSLFLPRTRVRLQNGYQDNGGWGVYGIGEAAPRLTQAGFEVTAVEKQEASLPAWVRLLPGGLSTDVLAMNSGGNPDWFALYQDQRAYADDVPVLNEPAAVHFTHSWSMHRPDDPGTIAGQWLEHGAYAYVGSMHEPYLAAFVPPTELALRWTSFVPFLVAARHWQAPGPFAGPWKVNTFGDPLMLVPPPARAPEQRVTIETDYGDDLRARAKTLMRATGDDRTGTVYADAIAILCMLGEDEVAIELWRRADAVGLGGPSAPVALGAMFRRARHDLFTLAYGQIPLPDAQARDMLWHLFTPRLGSSGLDDQVLLQLEAAVRGPLTQHDVRRLAPALARAFGRERVRTLVERELRRTQNGTTVRELSEVLKRY